MSAIAAEDASDQPGPAQSSDRPEPDDWHRLLLRMAGWLPDDVMADARSWLARADVAAMADLVAFAALTLRVPVWDVDALMLVEELARTERDLGPLADLMVTDGQEDEDQEWVFAPQMVPGHIEAPASVQVLDLSSGGPDELDALDRVVVQAAERENAALAVWRAWRVPSGSGIQTNAVSARSKRVFLVCLATPSDQEAAVTARLQDELAAAGESDPAVEVWLEGSALPQYQTAAWLRSALLWAREPAPVIRMARAFDVVDPVTGPGFEAGHPRVPDQAEVERLLERLKGAPLVAGADSLMIDVLEPQRGEVVPMSLRTDGHWVWADAVAYYLEQHGISPEPQLVEHLSSREGQDLEVSSPGLHRVWCFLLGQGDRASVA